MKRFWSIVIIVIGVFFAVGSSDKSSSSSGSSSSDRAYIRCLCKGFNGVVNMRGCRGNENTMECSRRECGKWDSAVYQEALREPGCGK